jgi:hypothetical protein
MWVTRYRLLLLVGLALTLLGAGIALTQVPGPPGRGGRGGGRGRFDPNMMFNFMSGGKDVIAIAEVQPSRFDPTVKERMEEFAKRNGISNGQLTREQFAKYMEERMAERNASRGGTPPPGPPVTPVTPGSTPSTTPGTPGTPSAVPSDDEIKEEFRRRDRNNDGVLSPEEMPRTLRAELSKWDRNNNGTIEPEEFAEYYKARQEGRAQGGAGWQQPAAPPEEDRRPTVYRVGKLPKGLPPWFEQLDKDKDGQVGLYEWKAAGKPVAEFQAMDRNGDGFVTVEEALLSQKILAKSGGKPPAGRRGPPGQASFGEPGEDTSGSPGQTEPSSGTADGDAAGAPAKSGKGGGKGGRRRRGP